MADGLVSMKETQWQRDERLRAQLENERISFLSHWRELSDYLLPRRSRFTLTDANRGDRRNQKIIDSTGTLAVRTLRSGMMSGLTSPSRPWFRLTTSDADLAEYAPVKRWLDLVTKRMEGAFLRSNLYNSLPVLYGDLGVFATAAMVVEEDFTGDLIRTLTLPIGSYMIALNDRREVNVMVREFQMTVRQLVMQFGIEGNAVNWERFSAYVKTLWDTNDRETWITVVHIIQPNPVYDEDQFASKFKRFRSVYYERGLSSQSTQTYAMDEPSRTRTLRESGYDYFPVLAPRWETTGEDAYGTSCPGMEALGDVKQLQLGERRILQAIEKSINPPMTGPTILKTTKASILPGDITHLDIREGQLGFRPTYQIDPRINEMEAKQEQVRTRIRKAFFEDLFRMLIDDPRATPPTAEEIKARNAEKLNAVGPVLEQLNQDLFDPLIDIAFDIMVRQGVVPQPIPEELAGQALKVEYVSIMAQAQKMIGLSGIERLAVFTGQVAAVVPEVLDKLNTDEMVDSYADRLGVDPDLTRSDEEVDAIRAERAKAQQAQALLATIQQGSEVAKNLGGADMSKDTALSRMAGAPA